MSASSRLLHRLSTAPRCEQKKCPNPAVWLLSYNKLVQFLCKEHTLECMSDVDFWSSKPKGRIRSGPASDQPTDQHL
jgi:hypothetical protein